MRVFFARSLSARLRGLTSRLRSLDRDLKSNPSVGGAALREFRQAVDTVRMTAWTFSELRNVRLAGKDPQGVISFLTAERLRRFSQMARNLLDDFEQSGTSWPDEAVRDLADSLTLLREGLGIVGDNEQARKGA